MEEVKDINKIIIASFSGEANSDELNQLKCWLQESEENKQTFELLRQFWNHSQTTFHAEGVDEAYQKFTDLINKQARIVPINRQQKNRNYWPWISVAATILLLVAFSFLFLEKENGQQQDVRISEIIKSNPKGQKSTIILPDSSIVWLNSDSKIAYLSNYGEKERSIWLDGEAYFEVYKNPSREFKVITNNITTTAIGTSFNINTNGEHIKVTLISGKVKIENSDDEVVQQDFVLNPGEEIVYDINKSELLKHKVDIIEILYWKENIISFKKATFNEVINKLETWYGVQFVVDEQLDQDWNFTGKFQNDNLENVLLAISFAKKFEFEIENKMVYIRSKE